jgi:L-ascorbate metabolism protein UlaG (beta-lactamase superfamily)
MKFKFKWIGGATWILNIEGIKIACDPVLCPKETTQDYFWFRSQRLEEPVYTHEDFQNIDLWLITHAHEDHLDSYGIDKLSSESEIICHKNVLKKLKIKPELGEKVTVLKWGEKKRYKLKGVEIIVEAMLAIHGISPLIAIFAGGVNGYWITIKINEKQISMYVTGDTITNKKVLNNVNKRQVDILIPNLGAAFKSTWVMTLTLSAKMLQDLIVSLNPKLTIPVHFGTFQHYVEPISEVKKLQDDTIVILKPGEIYGNIISP